MSRRRPTSERAQRIRDARRPRATRLGRTVAVLAIVAGVCALGLTILSLAAVFSTFGVVARQSSLAGGLHPLLLTGIVSGGLVLGGSLMLIPRTAGWWLTLASAVTGLLDLARIYSNLVAAVNLDHPEAASVLGRLAIFTGLPAAAYVGVFLLLLHRRVRAAFRIGDVEFEHEPRDLEPEDVEFGDMDW